MTKKAYKHKSRIYRSNNFNKTQTEGYRPTVIKIKTLKQVEINGVYENKGTTGNRLVRRCKKTAAPLRVKRRMSAQDFPHPREDIFQKHSWTSQMH